MILLAGFASSCKHNPFEPPPKCDTCKDTTHCDTCKHDTIPKASDTTSHNFTWSQSTIPGEAGLTGCWVFGSNDIYVVGGAVYKSTDGKTWKDVSPTVAGHSLSGGLSGYSMFALGEDDYWLTYGGVIYNVLDGQATYYVFPKDSAGFLHSSWGTSYNDMYAVGDGGTILHFDGGSWTKMASGTTGDLHSIWGTSDQNIWAAGYNDTKGTVTIVHYHGTSWQVIDNSTLPGQIGSGGDGVTTAWTIDSASSHRVYLAGAYLYKSVGGTVWSRDSGVIQNALSGGGFASLNFMAGNAINDYFVAGAGGFLSHWSGKSWDAYKQFFNFYSASHDCYGLSVNGNTVCMVGVDGGAGWVVIGQR
jgi:hypothetical protein